MSGAFDICGVREVGDGRGEPLAAGLMAPVPGDAADEILLEARDGKAVKRVFAESLAWTIQGEKDPLIKLADVRIAVLISDARVAFGCSKFDKGGGWGGGPTALALNAGSRALAARRRRGKMLVGQVRYPWVSAVYASTKHGWRDSEQLRLVVVDGDARMSLTLGLPKSTDAAAIATEVVHRAARFRLATDPELADAERARLQELAALAPIHNPKGSKDLSGERFPTHWPPAERSASFGSEQPGGAT